MKLKDIEFNNLDHTIHETSYGKIINLKEHYEFQTPSIVINSIEDEYLNVHILPNEASKIFFNKINLFEDKLIDKFKYPVDSLFNGINFKLKLSKTKKVYLNGEQFNFYHLKPLMKIICLVSIDKLWISQYSVLHYNLKVNEILVKS
jgi:hypothetical protein